MNDLHARLGQSPEAIYDIRFHQCFDLSVDQIQDIHLEGARRRFETLRGSVRALEKLAAEQGVERIDTLDDVVPLLFKDTVYKSYPLSFLERGRFDALTRWLDGLTSIDLSGVDVAGIELVDDWIDRLDEATELRIAHTSGTSGKLSIIPRTRQHWLDQVRLTAGCVRDWHGPDSGPDLFAGATPYIRPSERYGASAQHRAAEAMVELVAVSEENTLFLYPDDRFSADMASLAGRIRTAESRGEAGKLELSPALLARREEFAKRNARRPDATRHFFEEARRRFGGRDVLLHAIWVTLLDAAEDAQKQGIHNLFGPNSALTTGGGFKGRTVPPDWREQIVDFIGFDNAYEYYGMTEMISNAPRCREGNYHVSPVTVPFLLDPDSGKALPRRGTQTGRFAFLDLLADNYWGGLVTGDQVTMGGWDDSCACGRPGPYVHPDIRRFSEIEGGDDKIDCAGAPEAHNRAMEYLVESSGGE
jgi:hypothetical protein